MVPRHVTLLSAIFVSHLFLGAVDSAPNAALLKLMAAKQDHFPDDNNNNPPHSSSSSSSFPYINPPFLSSPGNENDDDDDDDDNQNENLINDLWLTGNGNHAHPEEEVAVGGGGEEDDEGRQLLLPEASKRFHPSAFYGSRGKRLELAKRFFHQGFVGSRGKRLSFRGAVVGRRAGEGEGEGEGKRRMMMVTKRFHPAVYTAVRGKRYMPGLEALFLSQMYKKLDAEKWKRQSLLGFHAARG